VLGAYRARPHVQRGRDDTVGAEPIEREHGTDDVNDGVQGTNLVKVHSLDWNLVYVGFHTCEPPEEVHRPLTAVGRESRAGYQSLDVGQMPVPMSGLGAAVVGRRTVGCLRFAGSSMLLVYLEPGCCDA
jgi:hypothetical protein